MASYVADKFKVFCRNLTMVHAVFSSYNHQSNYQTGSVHWICKRTMKKCFETNTDVNLALIQIRSTQIGTGLTSPATIPFSRLIEGILPKQNNRLLVLYYYDEDHYNAFKLRQGMPVKNNDTVKEHALISLGSTSAVQREDGRSRT